jgi:hypothetical protein
MSRAPFTSSASNQRSIDFTGSGTAASSDLLVHCNPCFGLPPILIESPLHYFATQAVAGLTSLVVPLLPEVFR